MREMPFQSIKFQKFFGGACPRTPLNSSLPCSDVHQIFPKSAPGFNGKDEVIMHERSDI